MKTKFYTILAFLFVTVSLTAQIDRSQQPKPGPAPKISLEKPTEYELKNGQLLHSFQVQIPEQV